MKPILKWVGGKSQIIKLLQNAFPKEIKNYYEPFLGGGAVLLKILEMRDEGTLKITGKIFASDINPALIGLYVNIRDRPLELIKQLAILKKGYHASATDVLYDRETAPPDAYLHSSELHYYHQRDKYNALTDKTSVNTSALFLFLNKTCFRGLYRESKRGDFNVAYGHYKYPQIFVESEIMNMSRLIQDVVFSTLPFQDALSKAKKGDFVYLDPPYLPKETTSFVSYTGKGFDDFQHQVLFETIVKLQKQGTKVLISNHDLPIIRDSLPVDKYTFTTVSVRRGINSKDPSARCDEVLIKSW